MKNKKPRKPVKHDIEQHKRLWMFAHPLCFCPICSGHERCKESCTAGLNRIMNLARDAFYGEDK